MILLHDLSESVFGKWKELFEGFWTGWIGVLCSDESCYHALITSSCHYLHYTVPALALG